MKRVAPWLVVLALCPTLPAGAQNYPTSTTGTYLGQPSYGNAVPGYGAGYGGYGSAGPGTAQPYGTAAVPYGARGYGNAYGTNQPYGTVGGQGYGANGQGNVLNGQGQQTLAPSKPDDVMTLGKAGTAAAGKASDVLAPQAAAKAAEAKQRTDPRGQVYSGTAKVVDGKTLVIGSDLLVLNGADAPAADQTCTDENGMAWECGRKAMDRLAQLTADQRVYCVGLSAAGDGVAATCKVGTTDLGKTMVQDGLAMSPKAVAPVYLAEESMARVARRGMWVGTFKNPWDARAGR